ncbi:hypothetical protein EIP86_007012 [Pleurotus ostreatoroseus]|nr:hypothetical protein EIP86_007012 [Pleurotus ostreatoroseus]
MLLLREIVHSTSCTAYCVHPSAHYSLSFALALAEHGSRHQEWSRSLTAFLVERVGSICQAESAWPPGATESLYAILSLPPNLTPYPEASDLVFTLVSSENTCLSALLPFISVRDAERSRIHTSRAIGYITSLISRANARGRIQFLDAMQSLCTAYATAWMSNRYYAECNIVRHAALVSTVHSHIQVDETLSQKFALFYGKCASAICIFRTHAYPFLTDKEKIRTAIAAKACLDFLDGIEPVCESLGEREKVVDTDSSVYRSPDTIFQELAAFLDDEAALKYERVRRFRQRTVEVGMVEPGENSSSVIVEHSGNDGKGIASAESAGAMSSLSCPHEPLSLTSTRHEHVSHAVTALMGN